MVRYKRKECVSRREKPGAHLAHYKEYKMSLYLLRIDIKVN